MNADDVESALRSYISAREEENAYWPRYRRTLALAPHEPNYTRPSLTDADREAIEEWQRLSQATTQAYERYVGVTVETLTPGRSFSTVRSTSAWRLTGS